MTTVSYSRAALCKEYAMALGGVVMAGGPLAFLHPTPAAAWILAAAATVFAAYALGAIGRHLTRISFDDQVIRSHAPRPASLAWRDIEEVQLHYFSTRRDGARGWMTLMLRGGRERIRIESSLDGFEAIAGRAAQAVRDKNLVLDRASVRNFCHLGIRMQERGP